MPLTDEQAAVVAHEAGPARVIGGFGSGKTEALRTRAERLASDGRGRVLAITRNRAAARDFRQHASPSGAIEATTFSDLALGILARNSEPLELVGGSGRRALVAELLAEEGPDAWPTLCADLHRPEFVAEVADMVCHYQASYLGTEELRTHATAAGVAERWEELASFTARYLGALAARGRVDWAGALVGAGLLLREPAVCRSEMDRFDHVVVDDFEAASFATNRLLTLLTGPGADVVVAGNPDAAISGRFGGTSRFLMRFGASFGAVDLPLSKRLNPPASSILVRGLAPDTEPMLVADELRALHALGEHWSDMAVVVCRWRRDAERLMRRLSDEGIPVAAAAGPDPWDTLDTLDTSVPAADTGTASVSGSAAPAPANAVTITSIDAAAGRHWPNVILTGCVEGSLPAVMERQMWFDRELLEGPDVPSDEQRQARWEAEERRRYEVVQSRARRRLVLISAPVEGGAISRFLHRPD